MTDEELRSPVVVHVAPTRMAAEVVKARLESCGIHAALQYESAGRVLGLYIDGWGETRVLVPASQAAEARAILAGDEDACQPEE
ncbi:MAG: DUF2007 domain-containing protein [Anaerolineae bacterium]|nr:DUF2007 domain-containing protein [Anaerolineae bacterium]